MYPPTCRRKEKVILGGGDPVEGTVQAVLDTVLPIQGPPGTGKTWTAARAILALIGAGRRVAVAPTSHEAISNLLRACLAALPDRASGLSIADLSIAHKLGTSVSPYAPRTPIHASAATGNRAWKTADVVGGTAFHFCKPEFEGAFDRLVVDEAGQVGLANRLAMGRCARNVILDGEGSAPADKAERDRRARICRDLLSSVAAEIDAVTGGRRLDAIAARCEAAPPGIATATGRPKAGGRWR